MTLAELKKVNEWLNSINEQDQSLRDEVIRLCKAPDYLKYILMRENEQTSRNTTEKP